MYDIIIGSIPVIYDTAPIAPAQLKSFVESYGFKCKVVDWNRDIRSKLDKGHALFNHQTASQILMSGILIDDEIKSIMNQWVDDLKELDSKFIGISCFGLEKNKMILYKLLEMIKKKIPDRPIVIGGTGIPLEGIGEEAYKKGLADYYVVGEGEYPLLNILKGNYTYPGINGVDPIRIKDLNQLPPPDYSDLDIKAYPRQHLFVENSRGCPMNCAFCYKPLKRFRYRDGEVAAKQILHLYKKHDHTKFRFSDYLINGNLRQLKKFCNTIISYKENGLIGDIELFGFFFVLPRSVMGSEYYSLMKKAGFDILSIGVESGSEKVRYSMRKRFSNDDLYFAIEESVKNKINLHFLFMVGYPTEGDEEFEETMNFIEKYQYINDRIEVLVSMGNPYIISLKRGSLEDIYFDDPNIETDRCGNWVFGDNTYKVRVRRWFRLRDRAVELGYPVYDRAVNTIKTKIKEYEKWK